MPSDLEDAVISLIPSGVDEGVSFGPEPIRRKEFQLYSHFPRRRALWRLFHRDASKFSRRNYGRYYLLKPSHLFNSRRLRRLIFSFKWLLISTFILLFVTAVFRPSYTYRPPHYYKLEKQSMQSDEPGRSNPLKEKIFIAISLYDKDGHLAGGRWGESILELVDLLGPNNVFLSIYQSDSGNGTALDLFASKVKCNHEIINDFRASREDFSTVTLPNGSQHVKRIQYLAEMRNRALRPLDEAGLVNYDKVLFLNDISFHPVDAAQLLFSTNIGRDGRAQYLAACGIDYSNPFKFYDVFVTRDSEGYSMGLPFYPIFSNAGQALSRSKMLSQSDAVPVKSCWSGMLAVQAKYIQSSANSIPDGFQDIGAHAINPTLPRKVEAPIRFRAEPEVFFDACECCLFLADVLQVAKNERGETGIYINPYIRVAYDQKTLGWLPIVRRFERLFSWPHRLITTMVRLPTFNPHRAVEEGDTFEEEIWKQDMNIAGNGSWILTQRTARNGLYCGVRDMQVLQNMPRAEDTNWFHWPIPPNQRLNFPT